MNPRLALFSALLLLPRLAWAQAEPDGGAGAALSLAAAMMLGGALVFLSAWAWVKQRGLARRLEAETKEKHKHRQALQSLSKVLEAHHPDPTPIGQLIQLAQSLKGSLKTAEDQARLQQLLQLALELEIHLVETLDQTQGEPAPLRPVPLDLRQETEWLFARWAKFAGNSKLQAALPPSLPLVLADGVRLRQVLHGLIELALKAAPQTVELQAEAVGDRMRIGILAQGGQFKPANPSPLLERWVTLQGGRLVQEAGAGGFGWAFDLALAPAGAKLASLPQPEAPLDLRLPPNMETAFAQGQGARIMVIDDEPANLVLLTKQLEKEGFVAECFTSALQALERLEDALPDLILLDLMMPLMSGYEFCAKVRQYHDPVQLPIVMVTARTEPTDLAQGLQAGANDYLTKPFDRMELVARVRGQLRLKELGKYREALVARKLAERDIAETKLRLAQVMDHSQNGMMFLNAQGAITYLNRVAEQILGKPKEALLGKPLGEVVALPPGQTGLGNLEFAAPLQGQEKEVYCSLSVMEDDSGLAYACLLSESMLIRAGDFYQPHQDHQLARLQQVCRDVLTLARREASSVSDCVTHLAHSLAEVHGEIQLSEFRKLLVKLMNLTLETWELATGKGKVDLAESSGIWRAYLDGGVFRTRTLDKYFHLDSLPANPRWKDVADTAEFVLEQKNLPPTQAQALLEALNELRRMQNAG